jgi:hypothetical protein
MAGQMPDYIGTAHAHTAWLAWRAGNLPEVRVRGQQALDAWRGASLVYGFQWTALWPLIGVAFAENQIAEAIVYARALLDSQQQRPTEVLEAALAEAVRAADSGDLTTARAHLERVMEPARARGCL